MNLTKKRRSSLIELVKNVPRPALPRDFRLNPVNVLLLLAGLVVGLAWQASAGTSWNTLIIIKSLGMVFTALVVLAFVPTWAASLTFVSLFVIGAVLPMYGAWYPVCIPLAVAFFFAPSLQIALDWEKAVILRAGTFRGLCGSGFFLLFPVLDRVTRFVDTRIRATDFSSEKTITMDTVPVYVDAIAFWMIWDPRKAILEVESYLEAVVLSAQTALRDAIGKHELSELLSERDRLGKQIQEILDHKTNPWGITILSVEIRDIIVPKDLEDALSRRAQAERERQARVILGTAEIEISDKFVQAAERYRDDPTALQLRAMNMVYEGIKQNGTVVLLPSGALTPMSLGATSIGSFLEDLKRGVVPGGASDETNKAAPSGNSAGGH